MSINEATAKDWDRLRANHPAVDRSKATTAGEDLVNKPSHYSSGGIECIDAIQESMSDVAFKGYLKGNVQKYIWRYETKGTPLVDLQKAQVYLGWLIKVES
jgi:hypothetical protein